MAEYKSESVNHLLLSMVSLEQFKRSEQAAFNSVTAREKEVLSLVAEGLDNPAVAAELGLSRITVQNHRAAIRRKLGITSEAGYVKYALAFDLIHFR